MSSNGSSTSSRTWTPEQRRAIETVGCSLLVSAAAGSGKTSVLAERCVHLVCDADPKFNVNQLLVVTFTEAAAAEMRGRIEQALRGRAGKPEHANDAHLKRQLALLDHANVSTLHGFCNRILRQHFHRLGLDPTFRVLDGDEAALMRLEVVRNLFMERYDSAEAENFRKFIDAFGEGRDDALMDRVIETYELLRSLVDPQQWMNRSLKRIDEAVSLPLEESELGREYLETVKQRVADLERDCRSATERLAAMPGFESYVQYADAMLVEAEKWGAILSRQGYDALAQAQKDYEPGKLPTISNKVPGKDVAKAIIDATRKQMKDGPLRSCLRFTSEEWKAGLRSVHPHVKVFLELVESFGRRFREEKDAARALDFSDLERFALRLLNEGKGGTLRPSPVARGFHRLFQHVLVDEYQDINEVQDAILALVSRECVAESGSATPNLFCVGDVKQSIYRFRLAEPARFLERMEQFRVEGSYGKVIDLQANFRSRKPLLDVLNQVFARLMTRSAVEIEYDQSHWLHAKASFPAPSPACFSGAPIELHLLPDAAELQSEESEGEDQSAELERSGREALVVARRIEEMMGRHECPRMQVAERDGTRRDIAYRDIVILLRATRYHADEYAEVLRTRGIPVYNAGGGGYFDAMEVRDVLSLLRLLDNQHQDVPMASVLRSPLSGLPEPDDAMARIRLACNDPKEPVPFHEAVVKYGREKDDELAAKLRDFLSDLKEWRELARQRPVADLIWDVYDRTGFLAFCNGLRNGPQRVANLMHLHERARQFGTFAKQGLYRFIKFLETLRQEVDAAQASELSESEDVVRIMSVHKSKGLEFPVVFLPELGKRINFQGCSGNIICDRHAHLGMTAVDERKRIRYPSLASTLVSERLRRQTLAEELRVLYVAMTRAKEHLVLVGTTKQDSADKWSRDFDLHEGPLPQSAVLGARTMLDWLGPVSASLSRDGGESIQLYPHPAEEIRQWMSEHRPAESPEASEKLARLEPLDPSPVETPEAKVVIENLTRPYPRRALSEVQAAVGVKDLVSRVTDDETKSLTKTLPLPRCMMDQRDLTAVERGDAVHLFLRHADFSRPCTASDLTEQLAELQGRKFLTPTQAKAVDLGAVQWLADSEAGQLLRTHAHELRRELPVNYAIASDRLTGIAGETELDQVMLRGRIDVLVPTGEGWTLLDYKSDRVPPGDAVAAAYAAQVNLYREGVERITSRRVESAYLVYLSARRLVPVAWASG